MHRNGGPCGTVVLMRPLKLLLPFVAAWLLCMPGCKNEITASMQLDGAAFVPTSCRSGELNNFMGVDLTDDGGRVVRLVLSPSNQPLAIVIADGKTTELGQCGALTVVRQNSTINDITNVEGNARLECEGAGRKLSGEVDFKNCH